LVDKFGERAVFSTGVFMVSLFTFLAGVAQSYEQLLFFRAAGGLGSSMFSVAASSVILRSVSDNQRGQAQSVYQGSFIVGGMAGPAIGGLLSVISLRAPFFVYSILLFCSGVVALFFLKGDLIGAKVKNSDNAPSTTIREALTIPAYRIALVLAFIGTWVFFGMRASILPVFVTEELNSTTAKTLATKLAGRAEVHAILWKLKRAIEKRIERKRESYGILLQKYWVRNISNKSCQEFEILY
jgi:MFS family permease